jgi:hypothetical protein
MGGPGQRSVIGIRGVSDASMADNRRRSRSQRSPYDQAARAGTAHAVPAFCDWAGALRVSTSISRPGAPLVTEGGASLL